MRFSIVIPVYEQYELLRQSIESIFHFVSPELYDKIIIVDDHSDPNGKLREYENYLETLPKVEVIKFDDYKLCFHCDDRDFHIAEESHVKELDKIVGHRSVGFGHGYSLQVGIDKVKTDFVLCFDADSAFVCPSDSVLIRMTEMFDGCEKVMSIGQLAGLMSNKYEIVEDKFEYIFGSRHTKCGGYPGSPVFACRMSAWRDNLLDPICPEPTKMPWVAGHYCDCLFERGYYTQNFPIMSKGFVFHAGGGILRKARFGRREGKTTFGMCEDSWRYGGRQGFDVVVEWYQGRFILNMTSEEYEEYLKYKYDSPFDEVQPPLDKNYLHIAKNELLIGEGQ